MTFPLAQIPPPKLLRDSFVRANLGVFLDRPAINVPKGGMSACRNVRVKDKQTRNENMGWVPFPLAPATAINLDGEQVLMIDQFFDRPGNQTLVFASKYDLFRFDEAANDLKYLTPQYDSDVDTSLTTALVHDAGFTTVTGDGACLWDTTVGARKNVKIGDWVHFGAADYVTQDDPSVPPTTWYKVSAVNSDTEIIVIGDASAESTGAYTIRQLFMMTVFNRWTTEIFPDSRDAPSPGDDEYFLTNGTDQPMFWNGSDVAASYYDPGFTCRILRRHKNMLLYADLVEVGQRKPFSIRNSTPALPRDVTGDLASEFTSTDSIDAILELVPLGDVLVAYHERSINQLQFVGVPFIFVIRTAVPGVGPVTAGAIADFGDFHEFLAADAAYEFNGVGVEEIGQQVFRDALRSTSSDRQDRILTHIDEEQGEVHWVIPQVTDPGDSDSGPTTSFVEHYLEETPSNFNTPMTIRDLPATASGFFERASSLTFADLAQAWEVTNFRWNDKFFEAAFPFNLFGDENGDVFLLSSADDQNGVAIQSFARFHRFALADGRSKGMLKRVEPYAAMRTGVNLTVRIYGTDFLEGELTLKETLDFTIDHSGNRFVSARSVMRFAEIEFITNALNATWAIDGYGIEAIAAGER